MMQAIPSGVGLPAAAALLLGTSGFAAYLLPARAAAGRRLAASLVWAGSLLGLAGLVLSRGGDPRTVWSLPWSLPWGPLTLALDPLSAWFLAPVLVIGALGSLYGLGYWSWEEKPESGRRLGVSWGLMLGAMVAVTMAGDGLLFLVAWEMMALAAYFAATVEEDPAVMRAGWVYLIATHAGTLTLLATFALWRHATGSFALLPAAGIPPATAGTIWLLAVVGFGFKAGLVPLHVWLPGTHANAPSHVSALMSGVLLKMGVYGIVRVTAVLPAPAPWWGVTLLTLGAVGGALGVLLALGQRDLKRLLAYSSIENVGIIAMGVGLAVLGRSLGRADLMALGMAGALLHSWNHGLFKSLLFLGAGAVIHATGTRDVERLGGLARTMPRVAALFGVGTVAICALPPLNGFVGEWLLYLGFLRTLAPGSPGATAAVPGAAVGAVVLALIGALAVACFVQLLGGVFLGSPRGGGPAVEGERGHDPPPSMMLPMSVLAAGCLTLGLFPGLVGPFLGRAVTSWAGYAGPSLPPLDELAPLAWLTVLGLVLLAAIGLATLAFAAAAHPRDAASAPTWDCGYADPGPRMQYTASSFGQALVGLFSFVLWPASRRHGVVGLFPGSARLASAVPDPFLDRILTPLFRTAGRGLRRLRVLQPGQTQVYLLYVVLILVVLLLWGALGAGS